MLVLVRCCFCADDLVILRLNTRRKAGVRLLLCLRKRPRDTSAILLLYLGTTPNPNETFSRQAGRHVHAATTMPHIMPRCLHAQCAPGVVVLWSVVTKVITNESRAHALTPGGSFPAPVLNVIETYY